jgi:hypothetical protein
VAAGARVWGKSWGGAKEAAHLNRRAGESLARGPGEHRRAAAGLGLDPESKTGRRREVDADERGPGVSDGGRRRAGGVNWAGSRLGWAEHAGDARTRGRDEGLPADFNEMGRDAKQGWDRGGCGLRCWVEREVVFFFFSTSF